MIQALVFDFDGLILETEAPVYQSWRTLYQLHGFDLPFATWATIIGTSHRGGFDPYAELERLAGRPLDWEKLTPRRRQHELEMVASLPIQPGVEQYLQDARRLGLKVGLASSSSCAWVTGHLQRLGLIEYFQAVRAKDDVELTKPDPELYLATLAELGVAPSQAIAFEDSPNGVRAAKAAGMFCVAVPTPITRQLPLDEADLLLESLADLPLEALVKKIER